MLVGEEGHLLMRRAPPRTEAGAAGFTLIELVVTISLVGVLVALGLPSFSAWIKNSQVRSVAESLQNGLRLAQSEALRRNRTTVMFFTNAPLSATAIASATPTAPATPAANGRTWWVQTVPSQFTESADTWFISSGALGTDSAATQVAGGPAAVCFSPNGRLVDDPAQPAGSLTAACSALPKTIDISQPNSDRPLRVTVAVGGQVRMCDPNRPARSAASPDGC